MGLFTTELIPKKNDYDYNGSRGRRIVFQTWKNDEVPEHWKASPESIRDIMGGWEYVLMTDAMNEEFISKFFPNFLPIYNGFPHNIQRADAIRYCIMAKANDAFGDNIDVVVYMDLDFVVRRPLDVIFNTNQNNAYFVASGNVASTLTNSFMAGRPGAEVFHNCVADMQLKGLHPPFWAYGKHFIVMSTTGPLMLNRVAKATKMPYVTLPATKFMPCSACNIKCEISDDCYLQPLEGGSWNGYDSKLYNACMCNWRPLAFIVIAIILVIFIFLIGHYMRYW